MFLSVTSRRPHRASCTLILALLLSNANALAQALASGDGGADSRPASSIANDAGPAGIIPFAHGFNASLNTTSQHDSSSGWSSLVTPSFAYRFNRFLSADLSIPVYSYISVDVNRGTKAKPVYKYATKHGALGDSALNGHIDLYPRLFNYTATITLGIPTGKPAYGLGAGQLTYTLNNHFEKSLGIFTPDLELGIGDSSSLVRPRVRKNYTSVGILASFQAGVSVDLPRNLAFESDMYEQLPLSTATVYSTTGRGKKKVTTATNTGPSEDNGFLNTLDVPLTPHVTLSGFYNRSLRLRNDVAGFSFTFLLKAPPQEDVIK